MCRPCWRIHLQHGCLHRCHYCHLGGLLVASLNVEEYIPHLRDLMAAHPWQQTFLLEEDAALDREVHERLKRLAYAPRT